MCSAASGPRGRLRALCELLRTPTSVCGLGERIWSWESCQKVPVGVAAADGVVGVCRRLLGVQGPRGAANNPVRVKAGGWLV